MIKAVLFDKDGTLLDLEDTWYEPSLQGITNILNLGQVDVAKHPQILAEMGLVDGEIVANSLIAAGTISQQVEYLVTLTGLAEETVQQEIDNINNRFIAEYVNQGVIIEGAVAVLEALQEKYFVGLITNDSKVPTQAILNKLAMSHLFDFVACADEYGPKPTSSSFDVIEEKTGIAKDQMIYVGDSQLDMEFARQVFAGVAFTYGGKYLDHITAENYPIDHLSQLLPLIQQLNEQKEGR